MLTRALVQPIADKASRLLGHTVVITDPQGEVLGAGPATVPPGLRQAARHAAATGQRVYLPLPEDQDTRALPGVALPLRHQDEVIGVLVISGDPLEVGRYGELVQNLVEVAYQQSVQAEVRQWEITAAETLVHDLLAYTEESGRADLLVHRTRMLGLNLDLPRVVLIIHAYNLNELAETPGTAGGARRRTPQSLALQALKESLRDTPQDLLAPFEHDRLIVLKTIAPTAPAAATRRQLKELGSYLVDLLISRCRLECSIGIGEYHPGLTGLAESYRDALQALEVGRRLAPEPGVYLVEELRLGHVLAGIRDAARQRFVQGALGELGEQSNKDSTLIHTLMVFCAENLNVSEAARSLFLHRNTLLYRLEQIRKLTGLDPRRFEDAVQLYLAVRLRAFYAAAGRQKPEPGTVDRHPEAPAGRARIPPGPG